MEKSEVGLLPEEKFLFCPELLANLLTMLDPLSIKRLTQSGVVDKKVLKNSLSSKIWAGLIKRSSYGEGGVLLVGDVKNLVAILKFLKLEESGSFLLPLLHHICEGSPALARARCVTLNCPGHEEPRTVSFHSFLLLEEVESSFGTSIQSIEKVLVVYPLTLDEPHLSALSSRIMRQENPVASIIIGVGRLGGGLQSAQAFSILLQANQVHVRRLVVSEAIEEEGWRILARIIPGTLGDIFVTREGLAQGKREDIKHIWDAGCWFRIFKTLEDLQADIWEASLAVRKKDNNGRLLEQVMDMSEQEFSEEIELQGGKPGKFGV